MKLDRIVTGLPGSVLNGRGTQIPLWAFGLGRLAILLEVDLAILI
jgi:hypothetical protein